MNEYSIFQKALGEVFESELNEFLAGVDLDQPHTFSDKFNRKMDKLIKRREKSYYTLISTAGRRVACIILILVMLSASSLTVKAVRDAVYDFIMRIFGDHTEVIVENDISNDYPKTIEDEYYISELPEGFELTEENKSKYKYFALYSNGQNYIMFYQYTMGYYNNNYNNERSDFEKSIDSESVDYIFHYAIVDDSYTIIWKNNLYVFEIHSNLDRSDIIKLYNSTKIKR